MYPEMSLTILKKNITIINSALILINSVLITIRSRLSVLSKVTQAHSQRPEQHYVPYLLANLLCSNDY